MQWIKRLFTDYLAGWLLVITPAIIGFLAWLQSQPMYIIGLAIIIAFAFTFLGINQFHAFQIRRKKGLAELGDEEVRETIRNWLDDPLFQFQRKVAPDYLFQFVVTDDSGRPITISRPKLKPTQLQLATAITLSSEQRGKYETLSFGEKQKITHDLRIEMARYGISFTGINEKLERVTLSDIVLLDNSLTEFYLKQRVFFVVRAFALYSETIIQQLMLLGKQESNKEDSQRE